MDIILEDILMNQEEKIVDTRALLILLKMKFLEKNDNMNKEFETFWYSWDMINFKYSCILVYEFCKNIYNKII